MQNRGSGRFQKACIKLSRPLKGGEKNSIWLENQEFFSGMKALEMDLKGWAKWQRFVKPWVEGSVLTEARAKALGQASPAGMSRGPRAAPFSWRAQNNRNGNWRLKATWMFCVVGRKGSAGKLSSFLDNEMIFDLF